MAGNNKFTLGLDFNASQNLISKQLQTILRNVEKTAKIKVNIDTNNVQQQLQQIKQQINSMPTNLNINIGNVQAQGLKSLQNQINDTNQAQKNLNNSMIAMNRGKVLGNQVVNWYAHNQVAAQSYDNTLKQIVFDSQHVSNNKQVSLLRSQFQQIRTEVKATDSVQKGFFGSLKTNLASAFQSMLKYQLAYRIINETVDSIREMVQAVSELDATLTTFNRLVGLSKNELEAFTDRAYNLASTIGRTGKDVIEGITEFKRAGYDIDQSFGLSKAAIVLTNVSDGLNSTSEAASDLIAVLKGYNMSDSDVMTIVDRIDKVGNESAISQTDITEALKKVSGTMYQSGTTLDETIGLITGAFSQLRDVSKSANGLITISQRLRAIDEDGEEIDGLLPELESAFGAVGVAIEDANGDLRSTYDIIKDYAAVFPTLSSEQRQYLGELAAGKRQITVWNAMVQGINDVDKAIEQSTNSLGTAEQENEIYKQSIAGLSNEFENAKDKLAIEVIESDWIKDFIISGTNFLEILTKIAEQDSIVSGTVSMLSSSFNVLSTALNNISGNDAVGKLIKLFLTIQTIKMGSGIFSFFNGKLQSQKAMQTFFNSAINGTLQMENGFIRVGQAEEAMLKKSVGIKGALAELNSLSPSLERVMFAKYNKQGIDGYVKSIDGLNLKQAQLVLTTAKLNEEEQTEVLTRAGLITINDDINASLTSRVLATELITDEQKKQVLNNLGLINSDGVLVQSTNAVTTAEIEEQLALLGLGEETIAQIMRNPGLIASNNMTAGSFNLLTTSIISSMKAFLAWLATPQGMMVAATVAIVGGIVAITQAEKKQEEKQQELINSTNELVNSYKSLTNTANDNLKTVESLADEYENLSKGVDSLGNNVSLTEDDFDRYNEIVNQIADMSPDLVQGWTNEGNAILSVKGNVEELIAKYKEAQQEAYKTIISGQDASGNDIMQRWNNLSYQDNGLTSNTAEYIRTKRDIAQIVSENADSTEKLVLALKEYADANNIDNLHTRLGAFLENDLGLNGFDKFIESYEVARASGSSFEFNYDEDILKQAGNLASAVAQTYNAEFEESINAIDSLANAYLLTNDDYENLSDNAKTAASLIVNGINEEFLNNQNWSNSFEVGAYVENLVDTINDNENVENALNELFTLDYNNLPIDTAISNINAYLDELSNYLDEDTMKLIRNALDLNKLSSLQSNKNTIVNNAAQKYSGATNADSRFNPTKYDEYIDAYTRINDFIVKNSVNTQDELARLNSLFELYAYDLDKAFEKYLEHVDTDFESVPSTISDSVNQMNKELSSQFGALTDVYDKIFNNSNGFNANNLDINNSDLKDILDEFSDLDGLDFEFDTSAIEDFNQVLADGVATEEEAHNAINGLATAWFYSTNTLENLNEKTADAIEQQLEQMGVTNANEIVQGQLSTQTLATSLNIEKLNNVMSMFSNGSKELQEHCFDSVGALLDESNASETTRRMLFDLIAEQTIFSNQSLSVENKIVALEQLAKQYGVVLNAIRATAKSQEVFETVLKESGGNTTAAYKAASNTLDYYTSNEYLDSYYNKLQAEIGSKTLEIEAPKTDKSSTNASAKETADEWSQAFEDSLNVLKWLRDNDYINEKQFLDQKRLLIQKFYSDTDKYAKEYYEQMHEYLEGVKALYESAGSAIKSLVNTKIDEYNEQLEKSKKILEDEQKAAEEAQKTLIKNKEAEIEALEKANQGRKNQLALEQSLYNLERAKNQRTKLVYKDGAFQYMADSSNIREQEQKVDDARYDIRRTQLNNELDELNNGLDNITKHYEELISANEEHFKSLINPLEEYINKFEELMKVEENAKNIMTLQSLGYDVNSIMVADEQTFNSFKTNYLGVLNSLYANEENMLQALHENVDMPINDYISATQSIIDNLNGLELDSIASGINSSNQELLMFNDGLSVTLELLKQIGANTPTEMSGLKVGKAHADGTVKGNAFANGTTYNGLSSNESGALRSEYGQPELTVYPNGTYEVTTTPTISNLPKGTVIFDEKKTNKILKGKAYAEGTKFTPLEIADPEKYKMLTAFKDYSQQIVPTVKSIGTVVNEMQSKFIQTAPPINNSSTEKTNNFNFGDIHLSNVNDVNGLSRAIINQLPNTLLQEMHKR